MNVKIEGTITIDDVESKFDISTDEGWSQWGASTERLCESMPVVEALAHAILEL